MNGQRIEQRRLELGLTQWDLARLVGVKQATISRLEANQQNATINLLARVATALQLPLTEIVATEPTPATHEPATSAA